MTTIPPGFPEDRPLTPAAFGELFSQVLSDGGTPADVPSTWVELLYPTDCGGSVPLAKDEDFDDDEHIPASFLLGCGVERSIVDGAWAWYKSLPRQS